MYELHITTAPLAIHEVEAFVACCAQLGGKALIVELARGEHQIQPMLTYHADGTLGVLLVLAEQLGDAMRLNGYVPVRCKIEVELNATAPDLDAHYLEWHGRVCIDAAIEALAGVCARYGAHLSRNAIHSSGCRYITMREGVMSLLARKVSALLHDLQDGGWLVERERWEGVVHDSNVKLDCGLTENP